jgi:hypothetical protein
MILNHKYVTVDEQLESIEKAIHRVTRAEEARGRPTRETRDERAALESDMDRLEGLLDERECD